jgi:serine/threonine protein kinase
MGEREEESTRVIRMHCSFEDSENVFVVMEFFEGDTLFKWVIEQQEKNRPPEGFVEDIRKVFRQITLSTKAFHSLGIIH